MKINPQIKTILREYAIPENDGIAYLLSIYFNCRPSYTPPLLVQRMNVTNILFVDSNREVCWNVPLIEDSTPTRWDWVKDWNESFGAINKKRKGADTAVLTRMKAFFSDNPDVRKEEVIGATKLYFNNLSDAQYLTSSHYFISKGVGRDRISVLESWVQKYRDLMEETNLPSDVFTDITHKMQ